LTKEEIMDAGLLISRLVLGLALGAHGAQKLFGWFGGYGPKGTGGFFESLGFRPGIFFAVIAGIGEITGGMLTAAGFLGPVGPALIILVMLVALITVHWQQGFFADSKGIELPMLYMNGALALAVAGPGVYSLDGLFGLSTQPRPVVAWTLIGIAIVIALANVAARRPRPSRVQTQISNPSIGAAKQ
jgi:putative oxidoreductase